MEVLISMFVLAVGLLSVAALIPAGRYEIAQGSRLDNAAMIGRASFRDIAIRKILSPGSAAGASNWFDRTGQFVWDPKDTLGNGTTRTQPFFVDGAPTARVAYAIDPLGLMALIAGGATDTRFPANLPAGYPHLTRIAPNDPTATGAKQLVDLVFRSSIDTIIEENQGEPFEDTNGNGVYNSGPDFWDSGTHDSNGNGQYDGPNSDMPPQQFWFRDTTDRDQLTNRVRRASNGDYSWLVTIVSDPAKSALSGKVTVSVAVFHKRDLSFPGAGESVARAIVQNANDAFSGAGISGGEMELRPVPGAKLLPVRPGDWIMLAGRTFSANLDYFGWYRVATARKFDGDKQFVTLVGADWDPKLTTSDGQTFAFFFDNIVAVYEKELPLEID